MPWLRDVGSPRSVMAVRPASSSIGTRARAALMTPPRALAVPGNVCTITAWGSPVTMA